MDMWLWRVNNTVLRSEVKAPLLWAALVWAHILLYAVIYYEWPQLTVSPRGCECLNAIGWESSVLKDGSCDWLVATGIVGVFYRWWKWDTLWQCSLSIYHWSCRRCAAESRSLLAKGGFAAYGLCISGFQMLKPTKRTLNSFISRHRRFSRKAFVGVCPWHSADNSYCMVLLPVCSI